MARSSAGRSIDVGLSSINGNLSLTEPSLEPPLEPLLELLLHQSSIRKISKKAGRRQRTEHAEDSSQLVDVPDPPQSRNLRPRRP